MDLTTHYLGLTLPHPFIVGASPIGDSVDRAKHAADAGAAAIVLRSLFEEQIKAESMATHGATAAHEGSFGEALSYLPDPEGFVIGPDEYLTHVDKLRSTLGIPVIASINGSTRGGWLDYATQLQQAGAQAIELNLYSVPTDPDRAAASIEDEYVDMVREVHNSIGIPVAVKLSPFYTSLVHFAKRLVDNGADALVLFNRFYEPDLDVEELEVFPHLALSSPTELLLRLRWLAILSPVVKCPLAVTGGVHSAVDAIKAIMSGASVVQLVSSLLTGGTDHIATLRKEMAHWLIEHEYESLEQMCGSMNLQRCPDSTAYERGNYIRLLQTWSRQY
jgi:dihydroorotate dehydrogenase (fumarate)